MGVGNGERDGSLLERLDGSFKSPDDGIFRVGVLGGGWELGKPLPQTMIQHQAALRRRRTSQLRCYFWHEILVQYLLSFFEKL